MPSICRTSTPVHLWLIHLYIGRTRVLVDGIHYLEPQQNRRQNRPWRRHKGTCNSAPFLRQTDHRGVFMLKYVFYRWTGQRIYNTLIVVNQYLVVLSHTGDWNKMIRPTGNTPLIPNFPSTFPRSSACVKGLRLCPGFAYCEVERTNRDLINKTAELNSRILVWSFGHRTPSHQYLQEHIKYSLMPTSAAEQGWVHIEVNA